MVFAKEKELNINVYYYSKYLSSDYNSFILIFLGMLNYRNILNHPTAVCFSYRNGFCQEWWFKILIESLLWIHCHIYNISKRRFTCFHRTPGVLFIIRTLKCKPLLHCLAISVVRSIIIICREPCSRLINCKVNL